LLAASRALVHLCVWVCLHTTTNPESCVHLPLFVAAGD
jgi:hypothetical protein